jgi:LysM repeat protein
MGSVLLPIPPDKLTLKIRNANKTMTLINEGEINFLKDAGLSEFEFEVLIPAVQYSFAQYEDGFKPIAYFTNHFEKLKTEKKPFQFIVTRKMPDGKLLFDTNMTVSMESYTMEEQSKEGFDLKVSFKLKQYKSYGTKIVKVIVIEPEKKPETPVPDTNQTESKPSKDKIRPKGKKDTSETTETTVVVEDVRETNNSPAPTTETTYTVESGDCLWNIAKEVYGDGSKYVAIYEANKDKITNPNLIKVGQTLTIPDVASAKTTTETVQSTNSNSSSTNSSSVGSNLNNKVNQVM